MSVQPEQTGILSDCNISLQLPTYRLICTTSCWVNGFMDTGITPFCYFPTLFKYGVGLKLQNYGFLTENTFLSRPL